MTRVQLSLCSCPHRSDIVGISCLKAGIYPDLQKQGALDPAGWRLAALCCVPGSHVLPPPLPGYCKSRALWMRVRSWGCQVLSPCVSFCLHHRISWPVTFFSPAPLIPHHDEVNCPEVSAAPNIHKTTASSHPKGHLPALPLIPGCRDSGESLRLTLAYKVTNGKLKPLGPFLDLLPWVLVLPVEVWSYSSPTYLPNHLF